MTTYVNNGTGKLYKAEGEEPVATIAYRVYRNPATEQRGEEWWGDSPLISRLLKRVSIPLSWRTVAGVFAR